MKNQQVWFSWLTQQSAEAADFVRDFVWLELWSAGWCCVRAEVVLAVSYVPFYSSLISSTSNLDKSLVIYEFLSGKNIEPNTNLDISRIRHFRSGIFPNFDIFRWYFPKIPCFFRNLHLYNFFANFFTKTCSRRLGASRLRNGAHSFW